MVICSLMHTCMGGLNKVMAVFMFSPVPAHNKGEICPNLGHVDFLFHDLNLGDMAVQWLTPAPQWLFVLLCGPAINWHLVQGVTPPKRLAPAPPADPDCSRSSNKIDGWVI